MTIHAVISSSTLGSRQTVRALTSVTATALVCVLCGLAPAALVAQTPAPAPSSTATPSTTSAPTKVDSTPAIPSTVPEGTKVGSVPDHSPYRDLETPQRFTVFGGYFAASKDVVGATPGSGALFGARYEITVGGPAQFFARAARVSSTRTAYNPTLAGATRNLGTVASPLYLVDLGFSFDLTGRKTWHSLVPIAGFGIGIASAGGGVSKDPYKFGTQFEGSTEFGIRYIPNNGLEARFTLGNTFYQTRYPTSYFTKGTDGSSVVPASEPKSSFRGSWMFTGGLSFPIFR